MEWAQLASHHSMEIGDSDEDEEDQEELEDEDMDYEEEEKRPSRTRLSNGSHPKTSFQNPTDHLLPFYFSNANKIKLKGTRSTTMNQTQKASKEELNKPLPCPNLKFVPLLSGEEPDELVQVRQTLFLLSREAIHKALEETQKNACGATFFSLRTFIKRAWKEKVVLTRNLDAIPTALMLTNGLDPSFVFSSFQHLLQSPELYDSKTYLTLSLTSTVSDISTLVTQIVRLYHPSATEWEADDIDVLPRNQEKPLILLIPSLESFPSMFLSDFIRMLPRGFRILLLFGLTSSTEYLIHFHPRAYARLHSTVFSFPSLAQNIDSFLQYFMYFSHTQHVYLQWHPDVLEWFCSSLTHPYATLTTLAQHVQLALLDYFVSTPLSCFVHPKHRKIAFQHFQLYSDLFRSLPSVFSLFKNSTDTSRVHRQVTQEETLKMQVKEWLEKVDLYNIQRIIGLHTLCQWQQTLRLEHPKSFVDMYMELLEGTLLDSKHIENMFNKIKEENEMHVSQAIPDRWGPNGTSFESEDEENTEPDHGVTLMLTLYSTIHTTLIPFRSMFPKDYKNLDTSYDFLVGLPERLSSLPPSLISSIDEIVDSPFIDPEYAFDPRNHGWESSFDHLFVIETWILPQPTPICFDLFQYRKTHVLQQAFLPNPSETLHYVLSHPSQFLGSVNRIHSVDPDISLLHRLYMEAEKEIYLSDIYEAFQGLLPDPSQHRRAETEEEEILSMVRFLRGMGELEYMGLIQKKGSRVNRTEQSVFKLSWGL